MTRFKLSRLLPRSALLLLLSTLAVPLSAQPGFEPGQRLEGFRPIDDYQLVLDGEPVESAQIFSNPTPAILLVASQLEAPVVLWPASRAVQTIGFMKLAETDRGTLDILPNPVIGEHGSFAVEGLEVSFQVGDRQAVLRPRPPILGLQSASSLLEKSAKYAARAELYEPSPVLMERLRETTQAVRVRVFFGTWCPACGQMVPRILKVAEQLEGAPIEFEFYGLPQGFAGDTEAEAYGVSSVPTGVVFVEGREAGRIAGAEWSSPEETLHRILSGS